MKYLYLDGSCGISGDMTVAALLGLGASREKMDAAIAGLNLEGVHVHVENSKSYSIAGLFFAVSWARGVTAPAFAARSRIS